MEALRRLAPAVLALALLRCGGTAPEAPGQGASGSATPQARITTRGGEVAVRLEIADDAEERARGLMDRPEVEAGTGMAFLFDGPTTSSFWMKDTLVPLSIAFWNAQGRIVALLDMAPCASDPCPTYAPGVPYVGALEVPRGFFREHGVAVGDGISIEGIPS